MSTSGNLAIGGRSTLTRMGTGALIAGPLPVHGRHGSEEGRQTRHARAVLDRADQNPGGVVVVPCNPDQGEKVRQFALNLMAVARRTPQAAEARRRLVQEAEQVLRAARSETGNLESARAALEKVETERLALPPAPVRDTSDTRRDRARKPPLISTLHRRGGEPGRAARASRHGRAHRWPHRRSCRRAAACTRYRPAAEAARPAGLENIEVRVVLVPEYTVDLAPRRQALA
jgi:hypothetical protein